MPTAQTGEAQVGLVIVTHSGCGECLLSAAAGIVGPVPAATAVGVQMSESFDRLKDHLAKNGYDANGKITLGANLTIDQGAERFTGDHAEAANKLLKRDYRSPFEIPESV